MSIPSVSIIIRTFNEERHLNRLFDEIQKQNFQDYETIVVDSGSIDLTVSIAQRRADKLIQIRSQDFTFGFSLNTGIRNSRGRLLVIISAHAFPTSSGWLDRLIAPLSQGKTAMVYGRQIGASTSKLAESADFERIFGTTRISHTRKSFFANNANSAARKDLWDQYPFDETLPGLEDLDWAKHWLEAGYNVIYEPAAEVYHLHEETWRQLRRRYYREAVAAHRLGLKTRGHTLHLIVDEILNLAMDLQFSKQKNKLHAFKEICCFRVFKTLGTTHGLWDGAQFSNSKGREKMFFDTSCGALIISGPKNASYKEVQIPEIKPGDVLIKVAYEGVCGTDLEVFDGTLGYYKTGKAKYPIIPGHEFSGRVVKLGTNVTGVQVGDRVVAECIQSCGHCQDCRRGNWTACKDRKELGVIGLNGGYSDYVLVPSGFVHRVPPGVTLRLATLCEPLAVVLKGLKRLDRTLGTDKNKSCLVAGAGPIGHLYARTLNSRGYQVDVYDNNSIRKSYFSGTSIRTRDDLDSIEMYDSLIDATGDPDVLEKLLNNSAPGAALLLLGFPYAMREYSFENIVAYDKTIVGSVGSSAQEFEESLQLLPQLGVEQFLQTAYPLAQFEMAWKSFREKACLKTLLEIDGSLDDPRFAAV